jgi:hypothetical protein
VNGDDVTGFLSRWSRRKLGKEAPAGAPADVPAAQPAAAPAGEEQPAPEPLPPVESLTPESDFKPFMRPEVDPGVKQAAMKQLFKDPQFNVMDGLDTYIEDYGVPDPIPESMMKTLYQARQHLWSDEERAAADKADAEAAAEAKADADAKAAIEASLPPAGDFPSDPPHPYVSVSEVPDQKA